MHLAINIVSEQREINFIVSLEFIELLYSFCTTVPSKPWHEPCFEVRSCLRKWKAIQAILGKSWDERSACSAGFIGRTSRYSSIIDDLYSLYDTSLTLFGITSLCVCYHMFSFSSVSHEKKITHRRLLELGSVSSVVSWDILFMLVSWLCKSEKL